MADEIDDLDGVEAEEPQAPVVTASTDQGLDFWKRKAEKAERRLRRVEKFTELQTNHPRARLEDFKGVEVSEWDRLAAQLYREQTAPQGQQDEPSSSPQAQIPAEELAQLKTLTSTAAGTTPAPQKKMSRQEAKTLPWPQRREMIAQGLVEGIEPPQ